MKIKPYNQYLNTKTKNSCTLYTLCNIMLYDYWVMVYPNFLLKASLYFNLYAWANFEFIYPAFVKELNKKLNLNFKYVKIPTKSIDDDLLYWLWIKNYWTAKYMKFAENWEITKADVDLMTKSWVNHNMWFTRRKNWYIVDSDWRMPYKMNKQTLDYAVSEWKVWYWARTIIPADARTEKIVHYTKQMLKAESKGKLNEYCIMNKLQPYFSDAVKLYEYWRK